MYRVSLLVTDLDNTLYDWVGYFTAAFYDMVDVASRLLEIPVEPLLDALREVHIRKGDSEYPFSLLETQIVRERYSGMTRAQRKEILDEAFHAFNKTRQRVLQPFPGVKKTLAALNRAGVPIVGHTEALIPNALFRLRKLGLEPYFSTLYARKHGCDTHPDPDRGKTFMATPIRLVHLDAHQRKPNPKILAQICAEAGVAPPETLYVGDSLSRDMGMAREAGTVAAWAKYGAQIDPEAWQKLVRITHWTREDVRQDEVNRRRFKGLQPDLILESSYGEFLDHITPAAPVKPAEIALG